MPLAGSEHATTVPQPLPIKDQVLKNLQMGINKKSKGYTINKIQDPIVKR